MKKIFICCLILLSFFISFAQSAGNQEGPPFDYKRDFRKILEQTQDNESPLSYKKLLPRFEANDTSLSSAEVLALMIGYTEDSHYKPFEDMEKEQEIFDLNDAGKFEEALAESQKYLHHHPLSLRVLKEASYAYHSMKNEDSANFYMDLVDKVMNAMIYSGSGKKPEAPIFSLGLADGEWFIPNIGMKVLNRDTDWNKNNHFLEIIEASKSGDDKINFYFVIQHAKDKIDDDKVNESEGKKKKKGDKKKDDKKWQSKKDKKDKKGKTAETAPAADPVPAPAPQN